MIETVYFTESHNPRMNALVGAFVSQGIFGHPDGFRDFSSMAVAEDGKVIGGTIFHNWHPKDGVMELSSYSESKRWLSKPVINAMFRFPFYIMGCQLVVLRVSDRNGHMNAIAKRFGFNAVHIPRLRGIYEGEYIHTLTKEAWDLHPLNKSRNMSP